MSKGKLFVISAPSGAGKTSLVKQVNTEIQDLVTSVSHTTRAMRPAEVEGRDYFFVSVDEFKHMLSQNAFIEHAQVYDNFYGTARQTVEETLNKGLDVILEIDWQGAEQIKKILPDSVSIFILPPSVQVLQERLTGRGQDSEAVIARRMHDAITEISHYADYDYIIVNDVFQQALLELKSIILAYRQRNNRQQQKLAALLTNLLQ